MVKFVKLFILVVITITLSTLVVYGVEYQVRETRYLSTQPRETFFGNNLYESNRYAQKETIITHTYSSVIDPNFDLIASDQNLELYYESDLFRFILRNTDTNYLWYSYSPKTDIEDLNATMEDLLTAPFYIEYFPYNEQTEKLSTTTRREILSNVGISVESRSKGIILHVNYRRLDIKFDIEIYLENGSLVTNVPNESIEEANDLLYSIHVLPNFGATLKDETPGYMIIPDGPGALYRFKDNQGSQTLSYLSRYYGADNGIKLEENINPLNQLTMPIFGMVHGINQHAFLGVVESGDAHANFLMSPSGANGLNYNLTGSQFILRETFVFPTNLKGDGIPTIISQHYGSNLTTRYLFTETEHSNYVGLAKAYQTYLVDEGILTKETDDAVNLRLEVLQSDSERGLFGMNKVIMTTFSQTKSIVDQLINQDVNLTLILKGWNKDGLSGQMPYDMDYENRLGNTNGYKSLKAYLDDQNIESYLYGDYTLTYDHSGRINERDDFARGAYRRIMSKDINTIVYNKEYYLYPETTNRLLDKDLSFYDNSGSKLALSSSNQLYSYYKGSTYHDRSESVSIYQDALEAYGKIGLYQPNAYMFGYMDKYFDTPLYNAQYTFYDDTIPFLQIVLRGYIDMYAPLQNYFASGVEQTLMLIDFGIYPSFIVTDKETHHLKYTQANKYYSTEFKTWAPQIVDTYQTVSEALDLVVGSSIVKKEVLSTGVTKTTYDNGVYFIINYTDDAYTFETNTVQEKDFIIGGQS